MRQTADEKIEALKQKMNTSNIIKDDVFNTSAYSQKQTSVKTSYAPMGKPNYTFNESVRIEDLKNKIEKELSQSVTLESEKKELELLLQDQLEIQTKLRAEYGKHFDISRTQMESISQNSEALEKAVQERNAKLTKRIEENEAMDSEIADLTEDNKLIESELKRLGEKTTIKLREMQQKMQNSLTDFENLKHKNEQDLEKMRQFSTEKIKRIEDDYKSKLNALSEKLNEVLFQKQNNESELQRLQDAKKRAEIELESKIKSMKEQYYEDAFNQSQGLLKIQNNRHKTAIDNKESLLKKQAIISRDAQNLEQKIQDEEAIFSEENSALLETIKNLKEELFTAQRDLDNLRSQNYSLESENTRINNEIQREKFNFKQVMDNGKFKLKEHVDRFRLSTEEQKAKISNQRFKVKQLEADLAALKEKTHQIEQQNEKQIDSMRNQLNKNIYGTFNEYKDANSATVNKEGFLQKDRSFQHNYSNNF
jgi:hypothetical protein